MNLLQRLTTGRSGGARSGGPVMSLSEYLAMVGTNPFGLMQSAAGWGGEERIEPNFVAMAQSTMKRSGVVWGCLNARAQVFAEARLTWQTFEHGRPDRLHWTPELSIFDRPQPRWMTRDLLVRMMLDADLGGTGLVARRGTNRLTRMRPDWTTFVLASRGEPVPDGNDLDAELFAAIYAPPGGEEQIVMAEELAVFAPTPDPIAWFRGSSWLTTILRELQADDAAVEHRLAFFKNGATPNLVVSFEPTMKLEQVKRFKEMMEAEHRGGMNAYKTLYLAGAKATPVGHDFKAMDLRSISGLSETRIAAAAGVHPVILGLSEGLQGSSLNAGNYGQVRRRFADMTMAPLWSAAAGALQPLVRPPAGSRLWYDVRDVPALREDRKDVAEIQSRQASALRQLTDAGFTPESAVAAVENEDMSLLKHSGLFSVQLQPPGTTTAPAPGGAADEGDA